MQSKLTGNHLDHYKEEVEYHQTDYQKILWNPPKTLSPDAIGYYFCIHSLDIRHCIESYHIKLSSFAIPKG